MTAAEPTILIAPIGDLDQQLLASLPSPIGRLYGCRCQTARLLEEVDFALDERRDQYHSTAILEALAAAAPDHVLKVLGVFTLDLFIPILTYVFGEAQLGGRACLISTYRLNESGSISRDGPQFCARVVKEALHELGHTFKLRHCPERNCMMHYARSLEDVDRKSQELCRHCRVLLDDEMKRLRG
jgi:archaemetzincin